MRADPAADRAATSAPAAAEASKTGAGSDGACGRLPRVAFAAVGDAVGACSFAGAASGTAVGPGDCRAEEVRAVTARLEAA